jgi:hypothetical protein
VAILENGVSLEVSPTSLSGMAVPAPVLVQGGRYWVHGCRSEAQIFSAYFAIGRVTGVEERDRAFGRLSG